MKNSFRHIAARISNWTGTASVFVGAIVIIVVWAITGPLFHFSDTWQLVINTGTTIITFLMVFLIQNTQNRDTKAIQLKLDELLHATKGARTHFVGLEMMSDEDLEELDHQFRTIAENRTSTKAIEKLHVRIREEHESRKRLHPGAGSAVLQLLSHPTHILGGNTPAAVAAQPPATNPIPASSTSPPDVTNQQQ